MWTAVMGLAALLAAVQGECDTNTLFFGDVNPSTLPLHQLTVLSAVGTYVLEPNNVSVVAYRHSGRPDQFLIQEPTAAPKKAWVIATLPDNKKPAQVSHAYEVWPEAGNIIVRGEFDGEPWTVGTGDWKVNDCIEGRIPLPSLNLSCVAPTFGQCATNRWLVSTSGQQHTDILAPSATKEHSYGRLQYHSPSQKLYVGNDGRWRLASKSPEKDILISAAPAERLEYVSEWRTLGNGTAADGEDVVETDKKVECEPLRVTDGSTDPCASKPCKNNGTCFPVPDTPGAYHCRCRFDSVSVNCEAVRECGLAGDVANARRLYTTDLSPQGKAFYLCDAGYTVKPGTGSSPVLVTNNAFATCDGNDWRSMPECVRNTSKITIKDSYVHQCDFDKEWCDGYQYTAKLLPTGLTQSWTRTSSPNGGQLARAQHSSRPFGRQVAILQTPCLFLPAEGCVAVDVHMYGNSSLVIIDDDEVTLWGKTGPADWTTATLTLPPGSNRLSFEAILNMESGAKREPSVSIDNVRVFQWTCTQVVKQLFSEPKKVTRGRQSASSEVISPLLSLPFLFAYSRMIGVLAA